MDYNLSDLLKENMLKGYKRQGRSYDYRAIPIRMISVQEPPAEDFISKGELVLSTASGCDTEEKLLDFVKAVALTDAAALMLAFPDDRTSLPESVTACADERSLPLFLIPWSVRFRDIMNTVDRGIQTRAMSRWTGLQAELFNIYFEMGSLEEAADEIAERLKTEAAVCDLSGSALAESEGFGKAGSGDEARSYSIDLNQAAAGTLKLCPGVDPSEDGAVRQYICFPLSLWFNRRMIEDMTDKRLKTDFVRDLATKNYASYEDMLRQSVRLRFRLDLPYTCIIMRAEKIVPEDAGADEEDEQYTARTAAASEQIENLMIAAAKDLRVMCAAVSNRLEFIIYLENRGRQASAAVDEYVGSLGESLRAEFPDHRFYFGISEISLKQTDLNSLYVHASLALQYCLQANRQTEAGAGRGGNDRYCFTYLDTREAEVVSVLSGSRELRETAEKVMGKLKDNADGGRGGTDLAGTLAAYLRAGCNIAETARALHIHRQSLLYRLAKIEEKTEMSLSSHRDIFLLEIYARITSVY